MAPVCDTTDVQTISPICCSFGCAFGQSLTCLAREPTANLVKRADAGALLLVGQLLHRAVCAGEDVRHQLFEQFFTARREFDVADPAIVGAWAAHDEALALEAIEQRSHV